MNEDADSSAWSLSRMHTASSENCIFISLQPPCSSGLSQGQFIQLSTVFPCSGLRPVFFALKCWVSVIGPVGKFLLPLPPFPDIWTGNCMSSEQLASSYNDLETKQNFFKARLLLLFYRYKFCLHVCIYVCAHVPSA